MRVIRFSGNQQSRLGEPVAQPRGRIHTLGSHTRLSYHASQPRRLDPPTGSTHSQNSLLGSQSFWPLWQPFPFIWKQLKSSLGFTDAAQVEPPIELTAKKATVEWTLFPQLPDDPTERAMTHSPQKRSNFPVLGSKNIPIKGSYKQEAELVLKDGNLGVIAYQYGNLNQHGAFWLEDIKGKTLGLLSREHIKHSFGDVAPRNFYKIALELPDPDLSAPLKKSVQNRLIREAVRQAESNCFRLIVDPKNREEASLLRQHGFVNLQKALDRYVPKGQSNESRKRTGDLLAFDGFLDGYGANFFRRNAVNSAIQRN